MRTVVLWWCLLEPLPSGPEP
jgi:hypothetical protein